MKTEGAIRQKLKQVRFRYLKQRIEAALDRRPENCTHNGSLEGVVASDTVRVCFAQVDVQGRKIVLCDERFGGCARSESCSLFTSRQSKADVKAEFYAELEGMSFPEIAYNYPDMAALLWVIADEGLEVPKPDPHEFDLSDAPVGSGIVADGVSEHPSTATPDVGPMLAAAAAEGAFGYPDTGASTKPPSWIDRILGRVPS